MMFSFLILMCFVVAQGQDSPADPPVQTQPPEPLDSQNLALGSDDEPSLPIPLPDLGSGDMNYGPNPIEQVIQQIWHHPFDVNNQPEPDCKPRTIPWGGPFKMFAFCCGDTPKNMGSPGIRIAERRKDCTLWTRSAKCTPKTIRCCFCRNKHQTGFECKDYYMNDGTDLNDPTVNPASGNPKRDVIPMKRGLPHPARAPPRLTLPSRQLVETRQTSAPEEDDSSIAMEDGENEDLSEYQRSGLVVEYVCKPEYLISQGLKPRRKDPEDKYKPPPYQEYDPADETDGDDYSDLKPPPGWPNP